MKRIILIRHAKSSWKHDVIDHERPLNERGYSDTQIVSKYLKTKKLKIDQVLSSDAVRAKTTAEVFICNLQIDKNLISLNHDLYDFSGGNLIKTIKAVKPSIDDLMIFGHNHAITYFVNTYGDKDISNVPTCGVIIIQFNINYWADLIKGKTIYTLFPKDLK